MRDAMLALMLCLAPCGNAALAQDEQGEVPELVGGSVKTAIAMYWTGLEPAAAEVIFLTHNEKLHEVNLGWHPKAEQLLWTPETQQAKWSQTGGRNVRYRTGFKGERVRELTDLIAERTPWLRVRYAF